MGLDSTVLTVGTALNRAQQSKSLVHVLVQGQWIEGFVLGLDGHGAILARSEADSAVVRLELVAAVRVVDGVGEPVDLTDDDEDRAHRMGPVGERQLAEQPERWDDRLPVRS